MYEVHLERRMHKIGV